MFTLRELVVVMVFSGLLVPLCRCLYPANAATRRGFIIAAALILLVLPLLLSGSSLSWAVGLTRVPGWLEAPPLQNSWWLLVPSTGAVLVGLSLWRVLVQRHRIRLLPRLHDRRLLAVADEYRYRHQREGAHPRAVAFRAGFGPCSSTLGGAVVVLPDSWARWSEQTLRVVLAHELVHLARRDDVWLLLLRLLRCWYWWCPWLVQVEREFDRAVEESCDDAACHLVRSEVTYLDGVLDVVRASPPQGLPGLAGHSLVQRVRRFGGPRQRELDSRGLYWICLGLGLSLAFAWTLNVVELPAAQPDRRIIAIAAPADGLQFDVRLAAEERGPPGTDAIRESSPDTP